MPTKKRLKASTTRARLAGILLLALFLFLPPLMPLFDRPGPEGISRLPVYLFGAWLFILGLVAWLMEQHRES